MLPAAERHSALRMNIRPTTPFGSRTRLKEEFEARTDSIADHLGDMISAHAPDGTYKYASAAARDLVGYEPSELTGTWAYDYFHPDDISRVSLAHQSALDGAPYTIAYRMRRKSGEWLWVETTTRVMLDEDHQPVEILCSTRAIESRQTIERITSEEHSAWLERIREVLRDESIETVFQPVLDLETGQAVALEALSRFPGDASLTPDRWFGEAWEVGLGIPLELLAVRRAARALPQLPDGVGLSVNASPPTVSADAFLSSFDSAERITVELTEHLQIQDYRSFASALRPMRQAGGQVAIDDFGAGYASLRHILRLRPEWIKLDISLTERIDENPLAHAMASALASFAGEVGLHVVAEGIETEEELEALAEVGFRYGQGFYFGVPAPLDETLASLG
jgi:PAS domain S-box-containing protein